MNRVLKLLGPEIDADRAVDLSLGPHPLVLFNALCAKAEDVARWPDMLPTLTAAREAVSEGGRVPLASELIALDLITAFASFQVTARDLFARRIALESQPPQEPIA